MKDQILAAAKSPYGGAELISELAYRDPEGIKEALEEIGEEFVELMSKSPRDLADLFECVEKDVRYILHSCITLEVLLNLSRSPLDYRRILTVLTEEGKELIPGETTGREV